MGVGSFGKGWADRDTRVLCLMVSSFSGLAGLSAYGSGDPLADAGAVAAGLLAVLAGGMAAMAGSSVGVKGG